MKIAILAQSYPPMISGPALFTEKLAEQMSARGHEVLVLAASDRPNPYRVYKPHLRIERCRSYRNLARINQRFSFWPHRHIVRSLAEFAPDIIHLHDPFQIAISSLSYSRPRKIPTIINIHALPLFVSASFQLSGGVRKTIEAGLWSYARIILKRVNGSVAATQTTAETIYTHTGFKPNVISCGVDLNIYTPTTDVSQHTFALRSRLGIPEQAPVILHVGRLDKDKLVERVVKSAAFAMQHTPAHLLVVGDGTERARLEQLCSRLGIASRSHFTGFVSEKAGLPALYQLGTVFVMASEVETQGLVLLEAAACGLPIVAVQATCFHEIVHDNQSGYLVPGGDTTGMANCISELIQMPIRAHEMGQAGRKIVECHAAEKTFDAYENYYSTIIHQLPLADSSNNTKLPATSL